MQRIAKVDQSTIVNMTKINGYGQGVMFRCAMTLTPSLSA
jgi:hypothetical protein